MSAKKSLYLAFFTLFGHCQAKASGTARPIASRADVCAIDPTAIVSDACASYATLDALNSNLNPRILDITQNTDFFAYYRLNLYEQKCPVKAWEDNTGTCGNVACKVDTLLEESDIPEIWRAEELSKLEGPKAAHPGRKEQLARGNERPLQGDLGENVGESCVVEYDDECDERDYCVPEDESAIFKGDYVSLVDNPERFTGYAGSPVWDAIYRENCFSKQSQGYSGATDWPGSSPHRAQDDLRFVLRKNLPSQDVILDDECLEKRVFHRIISGMHASISTHICYDYLNQTTGMWGPNLQCYKDRLANHPERVSNVYFDFAILLRAMAKLRTYLKSYTFCSGDPLQDAETKAKILALADAAGNNPQIFDEQTMFQNPDVKIGLKEDFRNRFRNVSRLMDCVGCDKCRLWGKMQTVGYGTALKVLFEFDELKNGENPPLRRTELVALVNTLGRVSNSLAAMGQMQNMVVNAARLELETSDEDHPDDLEAETSNDEQPAELKIEPPSEEPPAKPKIVLDIPFLSRKDIPRKPARGANRQDEFDNLEEEDDHHHIQYNQTVYEAFKEEFSLVFNVWLFIMRSWANLPVTIGKILIMEFDRLWSYWLGLPVQARGWEIKWPGRDEL